MGKPDLRKDVYGSRRQQEVEAGLAGCPAALAGGPLRPRARPAGHVAVAGPSFLSLAAVAFP